MIPVPAKLIVREAVRQGTEVITEVRFTFETEGSAEKPATTRRDLHH
jgi:hypothetical protein